MHFIEFVRDESGEEFPILAKVRNGRLYLSKLGPQVYDAGATPRRAQHALNFSHLAISERGKVQTEEYGPAAMHIQRELPHMPNPFPRRSRREDVQRYYATLLGEERVRKMAEALDAALPRGLEAKPTPVAERGLRVPFSTLPRRRIPSRIPRILR